MSNQEKTLEDLAFEVKIRKNSKATEEKGPLAFADVAVNGAFVIHGVQVVRGKQLYLRFPAKKSDRKDDQGRDKWYDLINPITADARTRFTEVVIEAYEKMEADEEG